MSKRLLRLFAILFAVALIAAACGSDDESSSDSETSTEDEATEEATEEAAEEATEEAAEEATEEPMEELTASDVGVTEDTIKVGVLVADLDPLIESGFSLPAALSTDHLASRWSSYFDDWNAAGGINGRMVESVTLVWDPLDSSTMEDACTQGTLDNELFMVMNGSGFNTSFIPCFAEDNEVFFFFGETATQEMIDRMPDRLFQLNPTAEEAGLVGTTAAVEQGLVPEGAKVGILSSADNASINAAGLATQAVLEEAGFETELIEVTTLDVDPAVTNAETASAVSEFTAAGVGHVFVLMGFTTAAGFWGEVGEASPDWERTIIDSSSAMCTPFGASRTNPAAEGSVCVTAYDSYALPDGGLRDDDDYEAQCRAEWIEHFPEFEGQSDQGVPSGEIALETADGDLLYSDYAPGECTMVKILEEVLVNAGVNLTRDSLADAMRQYSGLQAFRSNGEGAFGPEKNFYSTQMHAQKFVVVPADTAVSADGTYLGCPAPVNCWIPVTSEWTPIEQ
jgi:hypothetical protein